MSPAPSPELAVDELGRTYDTLLASEDIGGLSNERAIEKIGLLIDVSGDLKRDAGTTCALEWCDMLERRGLSNSEAVLVEYFRANAWANRHNKRHGDPAASWAWEQPDLQEQILHLRRAIVHAGFETVELLRRCQILTNLANSLNTVGRFVEALEYWGRALGLNPSFGMALGNRGYGLERYAQALYDSGHRRVFLSFAYESLTSALSQSAKYEAGYEAAKAVFEGVRGRVASVIDVGDVA